MAQYGVGLDSLTNGQGFVGSSSAFCLMLKACSKCGKPIPIGMGSRCAEHPSRWRSGSTREWRKTRARILARDGYRCTTHLRPGERCPETRLLDIHHVDGGGNVLLVPDSELATVCRKHNPRGG